MIKWMNVIVKRSLRAKQVSNHPGDVEGLADDVVTTGDLEEDVENMPGGARAEEREVDDTSCVFVQANPKSNLMDSLGQQHS